MLYTFSFVSLQTKQKRYLKKKIPTIFMEFFNSLWEKSESSKGCDMKSRRCGKFASGKIEGTRRARESDACTQFSLYYENKDVSRAFHLSTHSLLLLYCRANVMRVTRQTTAMAPLWWLCYSMQRSDVSEKKIIINKVKLRNKR